MPDYGPYHITDNPHRFYHETPADEDGDLVRIGSEEDGTTLLSISGQDGHRSAYLDDQGAYHLALAILYGHGLLMAEVPTTDGMNAVVLRIP